MGTIRDTHYAELAELGYTMLDGIRTDDEAAAAVGELGDLVPQYDGSLRYQVKAAPGFEGRRYSKGVSTIPVHTEAPGWNPPPTYLALHCRVQATCGSGQTELADMRACAASLPADVRAALYERTIDWIGYNTGGAGTKGVRRSVAERTADGREIFRFSYNLLTSGQYDPPVDAAVDPDELPLGGFGVDLAKQAEAFFRESHVSVLIPEDCILIWDNQRMVHARSAYTDKRRHLTRYWISADATSRPSAKAGA